MAWCGLAEGQGFGQVTSPGALQFSGSLLLGYSLHTVKEIKVRERGIIARGL